MVESRTRTGFAGFEEEQKFGMISRCPLLPNAKVCWTHTDFPGFRPQARLRGVFGDPKARVITLIRRSKKRCAVCVARCTGVSTTAPGGRFAICRAATCASISISKCAASRAGVAAK